MDVEKQIQDLMNCGMYSRIEAIAKMDLGTRSEAAKAVSCKRQRRLALMASGMSHETACLVVNIESN